MRARRLNVEGHLSWVLPELEEASSLCDTCRERHDCAMALQLQGMEAEDAVFVKVASCEQYGEDHAR